MTDSDDKISSRYRELAREEPPASLDATIRARARRHAPGHKKHWMIPVSIAAVLMLGVGVSLRMQMEEPGIETTAPAASMADAVKSSAAPAPQPALRGALKERVAPAAKPVAMPPQQQDRMDASPREEGNVIASPGAMAPIAPPAAGFVPSPAAAPAAAAPAAPAALDRAASAPEPKPQAPAPASAAGVGALQSAAPARAKREAEADAFSAKELKKSVAAPENNISMRDTELERIAKLREAGKHAEADRALEEFRKHYADFHIPEAMWERIRPR